MTERVQRKPRATRPKCWQPDISSHSASCPPQVSRLVRVLGHCPGDRPIPGQSITTIARAVGPQPLQGHHQAAAVGAAPAGVPLYQQGKIPRPSRRPLFYGLSVLPPGGSGPQNPAPPGCGPPAPAAPPGSPLRTGQKGLRRRFWPATEVAPAARPPGWKGVWSRLPGDRGGERHPTAFLPQEQQGAHTQHLAAHRSALPNTASGGSSSGPREGYSQSSAEGSQPNHSLYSEDLLRLIA